MIMKCLLQFMNIYAMKYLSLNKFLCTHSKFQFIFTITDKIYNQIIFIVYDKKRSQCFQFMRRITFLFISHILRESRTHQPCSNFVRDIFWIFFLYFFDIFSTIFSMHCACTSGSRKILKINFFSKKLVNFERSAKKKCGIFHVYKVLYP